MVERKRKQVRYEDQPVWFKKGFAFQPTNSSEKHLMAEVTFFAFNDAFLCLTTSP